MASVLTTAATPGDDRQLAELVDVAGGPASGVGLLSLFGCRGILEMAASPERARRARKPSVKAALNDGLQQLVRMR